jgi:hypothetical protein
VTGLWAAILINKVLIMAKSKLCAYFGILI